jgi:membrane associated rhomboid family serine protease
MFIPLSDDNSRRLTTPFVVLGLIGINAAVWLLQLSRGEPFTHGFATVPFEITHGVDLTDLRLLTVNGQQLPLQHHAGPTPIHLTLITAMFMHGSWMHIIGNMLYLWIFGDQIEDLLGHARFVIFYVVCGLAAGAAQILYSPDSIIPCLGASGAIAGALGAYLITHPGNSVRVLVFRFVTVMPAYIVLGGWIVLQFVSQISVAGTESGGGVAYMAHIGGFVAGLILVLLLRIGRPARS